MDGRRWWLALGFAAVTFVLGLLLGRGCEADTQPEAAAIPAASVELRFDAGGVTLLPEGGLTLPPIEPLDRPVEPGTGGAGP